MIALVARTLTKGIKKNSDLHAAAFALARLPDRQTGLAAAASLAGAHA